MGPPLGGGRRSSLGAESVLMAMKPGSSALPPISGGKGKLTSSRGALNPNGLSSSKGEMSTHTMNESPASAPAAEAGIGIEKEMTNMKLRLLQRIFEEADEDGGGGLDMDEFRIAMRKALGNHLTDHELDQTFMKVDTNCDGTVDWDEYLSYMLLEYSEKDRMNFISAARPFPDALRLVSGLQRYQRNHDMMAQIAFMPNLSKTSSGQYVPMEDGQGRYITASQDGVINFWSMDLSHLKTNVIEPKQGMSKNIGVWVTDIVCLPNLNLIAVATTSCTITFYDLNVGKFVPIKQITDLEICATCLDYWYDTKSPTAVLLWGDARGNVCGVEFSGFSFLQPKLSKTSKPCLSFNRLLKGEESTIKAYRLEHIHEDFVLKVRYISVLDFFLSCSKSGTTSLFKGDLLKKKSTYFRVRDGVFSFDLSTRHNVIISGGKDAIVRVWNPYVHKKPVMMLQGHKTSVVYVRVNEVVEHIVSISEDKEINVFDMNTQTCIQTIYRKWVPLGPKPITAVFFHEARYALLLSSNKLGIFEHQVTTNSAQRLEMQSHSKAVNVVIYNSLFNQVVSGGADSKVNVWDITTGERIMQFKAHSISKKVGKAVDVEVTAMTFDPTQRRLLTAGQDGTVKIWNFNNGALLRQLETYDQKEVTGVLWHNQRIFAAGWNRQIQMYLDSSEDDVVSVWGKHHKDDIHAMAYLSPGTVASASYDGDILIWSVETKHVINKLNANHGIKPSFKKIVSYARMYDCRLESAHTGKGNSLLLPAVPFTADDAKQAATPKMAFAALQKFKDTSGEPDAEPTLTPTPSIPDVTFRMDKTPEASVERLLFLDTRPTQKNIANLVSVDANGWIRFWSVHHSGGLIAQFNAAHIPGSGVMGIATDPQNIFLFTGDSSGYVKTWDIRRFCVPDSFSSAATQNNEEAMNAIMEDFPLVDGYERLREKANPEQNNFDPPLPSTRPRKTWKAPPLVNSFRAHLQSISCVNYIPEHKSLLTCGEDFSVRMWTIHGKFIGIFNHNVPWNKPVEQKATVVSASSPKMVLGRKMKQELTKVRLPPDVRRVASATTFRVLYGKHRSSWRWAKNIVMILLPFLKPNRNVVTQPLEQKEDSGQTQGQPDRPPMEGDREPLRKKRDKSARPPTVKSSRIRSAKEKKKKSVLGGHINIDRKHHPLPQLKKVRQFHHQYDAYSSLPYHDLDVVPTMLEIEPPECIKELRARQKLMQPFKAGGKRVRTLVKMGARVSVIHQQKDFTGPAYHRK